MKLQDWNLELRAGSSVYRWSDECCVKKGLGSRLSAFPSPAKVRHGAIAALVVFGIGSRLGVAQEKDERSLERSALGSSSNSFFCALGMTDSLMRAHWQSLLTRVAV